MEFLQQSVNGLVQGSIYALIALGYTMVYGVLRFINFAHGEIYMLGAFAGFFASRWLGVTQRISDGQPGGLLPIALIFVFSMLACALVGVLTERLAYRPLRNAPRLTALITAIGVSMLLQYGGQALFTPDPQPFPALISGEPVVARGDVQVTWQQVAIIGVAFGLMILLQWVVQKTRMGRAMRAVALDRAAASLMGINTDVVIAFTFALGSALGAAAGVLNSVYQPTIDPLMGSMAGLKAFVAAVLGGIGSITGAVLGGLLLGFAEVAISATPYSQYRDAISFAILIFVLLLRPAGILGRNVAEKV